MTIEDVRKRAVSTALFRPTTLVAAIRRMGFVQADPIRAPARAQDLILRHRVTNYRAGDLERRYPMLDVEEDFLYVYGFMPRPTWELLHPRFERRLTTHEQQVLELVAKHERLHPRQLEIHLGAKREINAWGGYSKITTRTLERLHYSGLVRVVGREKGIRLYEPISRKHEPLEPQERLRRLALLIAGMLAPVPEQSLRQAVAFLKRAAPSLPGRLAVVKELVKTGELASAEVEGIRYLWPRGRVVAKRTEEDVRFLAPFDPLVWDRRRFEHLWGWQYRFEAYTPPPKRKMGYYAMPLLWRDDVVGWVNASVKAGKLQLDVGFAKGAVTEKAFERAFEAERARFATFLGLG